MATLSIVSRAQWGARHGRGGTNITPARGGCAPHYNGGPIARGGHARCAARVRSIESFHANGRGWAGIAYNYLICEHGYVFEGRGWGRRSAAQGTNSGNQNYLAIMFLQGGSQSMTAEMRTAGRALILWLRSRGAGSRVRPHSFFKSTSCPGNSVRAWIRAGVPSGGGSLPGGGSTGGGLLRRGDSGPAVARAQNKLAALGYDLGTHGADGRYGPATEDAVTAFQTDAGLAVDGVVGPKTRAALNIVLEDDMPDDLTYRSYRRQDVAAGEWTMLRFEQRRLDDESWEDKDFEPSVLINVDDNRRQYDSEISLKVEGLEQGQEFQIRCYAVDWTGSGGERAYSLPIDSPVHAGGALHCKTHQKGRLGQNKRLRVEVTHYGDADQEVYVDYARVETHYWDY